MRLTACRPMQLEQYRAQQLVGADSKGAALAREVGRHRLQRSAGIETTMNHEPPAMREALVAGGNAS